MRPIVELFWNICLLRTGPERVPTAGVFVALVVAVNFLVSALVAMSAPAEPSLLQAISMPVVAAAVLAGGSWIALRLKDMVHRFIATFTALMGADTVMTLVSWPLMLLLGNPSPDGPAGFDWVLILAQLAVVFWWVTIAGFIFSRALALSQSQGVAVAVFVILASLIVSASLVPMPSPPGQ